jgi:hypothetical protein
MVIGASGRKWDQKKFGMTQELKPERKTNFSKHKFQITWVEIHQALLSYFSLLAELLMEKNVLTFVNLTHAHYFFLFSFNLDLIRHKFFKHNIECILVS